MSFKKIMLMTALTISSCMAQNYINLDYFLKKPEKKEEIVIKPENCFRNTLYIGPTIGYGFTETFSKNNSIEDVINNMGFRRFKSNNHSVGLHVDYNHFVTDSLFIGIGYNVSYLPPSKEYSLFSNSTLVNERKDGKLDISYKNKNLILIHKKNSQYLTLRAGTLLCDYITLDANLSMAISDFSVKGAIFTHEYINGIKDVYQFNRLKNDTERQRNYTRAGIAPGIALTVSLHKNYSIGFNYMCEIYPKTKDKNKPKIITHNVFTKLSYHI